MDAPGHSWQNVATIGSSIGEKGTLYAAKVLACTALDLLEKPAEVARANHVPFVDLFKASKELYGKGTRPLTVNGIDCITVIAAGTMKSGNRAAMKRRRSRSK